MKDRRPFELERRNRAVLIYIGGGAEHEIGVSVERAAARPVDGELRVLLEELAAVAAHILQVPTERQQMIPLGDAQRVGVLIIVHEAEVVRIHAQAEPARYG